MEKIKLNKNMGELVESHGYELNPSKEYLINLENEIETQASILQSIQIMGAPEAIKDYHKWLKDNGFDIMYPNPTNDFVANYYGKKALWSTKLSQGIVVKAENDDDYYIVMECSRLNTGYKYTQIILTMGGCL